MKTLCTGRGRKACVLLSVFLKSWGTPPESSQWLFSSRSSQTHLNSYPRKSWTRARVTVRRDGDSSEQRSSQNLLLWRRILTGQPHRLRLLRVRIAFNLPREIMLLPLSVVEKQAQRNQAFPLSRLALPEEQGMCLDRVCTSSAWDHRQSIPPSRGEHTTAQGSSQDSIPSSSDFKTPAILPPRHPFHQS